MEEFLTNMLMCQLVDSWQKHGKFTDFTEIFITLQRFETNANIARSHGFKQDYPTAETIMLEDTHPFK